MTRPVVVLVDDEPHILSALRRTLRREPIQLRTAGSPADAIALLDAQRAEGRPVSLVVSDQKMPGSSGLQLLAEVAERHPDTARMLLTGWPEEIAPSERARLAITAVVPKPWDDAEIKGAIREALGID